MMVEDLVNDRGSFYCYSHLAQMAELVDALVSGTSVRKYVQVRVLFWALSLIHFAQVAELVDALG